MSKNKPNLLHRQLYKVVEPILGICYALFMSRAGEYVSPAEFADMVKTHFQRPDAVPDELRPHLEAYYRYLGKDK